MTVSKQTDVVSEFRDKQNDNVRAICFCPLPNHYHGHPTQTSPSHFQRLWKVDRVRKIAKSDCECCMSLRRMWSAAYTHSNSVDRGYLQSAARDSRDFSWKTLRISFLPQLVMSVHSISTNRYVTVIIIKWFPCTAHVFWGILLGTSVEKDKINRFRPTWWGRICEICPIILILSE